MYLKVFFYLKKLGNNEHILSTCTHTVLQLQHVFTPSEMFKSKVLQHYIKWKCLSCTLSSSWHILPLLIIPVEFKINSCGFELLAYNKSSHKLSRHWVWLRFSWWWGYWHWNIWQKSGKFFFCIICFIRSIGDRNWKVQFPQLFFFFFLVNSQEHTVVAQIMPFLFGSGKPQFCIGLAQWHLVMKEE